MSQQTSDWQKNVKDLDEMLDNAIRRMFYSLVDMDQKVNPFPRNVIPEGYNPVMLVISVDSSIVGLGFCTTPGSDLQINHHHERLMHITKTAYWYIAKVVIPVLRGLLPQPSLLNSHQVWIAMEHQTPLPKSLQDRPELVLVLSPRDMRRPAHAEDLLSSRRPPAGLFLSQSLPTDMLWWNCFKVRQSSNISISFNSLPLPPLLFPLFSSAR